MSRPETTMQIVTVGGLSFCLALLLWVSLLLEQQGALSLSVPVLPEALPAGLVLATTPPSAIEVRVSGPKVALLKLKLGRPLTCRLDLSTAQPGLVQFRSPERLLQLDHELKVESVTPASIDVVVKSGNGK